MNKIKIHIEKLFENAPKTSEASELKEEITQNIIDKYNCFLKDGKNEDEAYYSAISTIGDINELIEQLDSQQLPSTKNYETIEFDYTQKSSKQTDASNTSDQISFDEDKYILKTDAVHSIKAELISGSLSLYQYDGDHIEVYEKLHEESDEKPIEVKIKNGKLIIDAINEKNKTFTFNSLKEWRNFKNKNLNRQVIVKIPSGKSFEKIKVESVAAKVFFGGIHADLVKIENVSGKIELIDIISKKLKIEQVSGTVLTENLLCNNTYIETVSGKVNLNLDTIQGFSINYQSVSGKLIHNITENFNYKKQNSFASHNYILNYKDARNTVNIETVSGSAEISID